MDGLEPQHKGSKPRTATPAVQAKVYRKVQQKPNDGSTHWSVRKLAAEMGVSKSSVHRILSQARLQPHRLERYMTSNDPDFESKAADFRPGGQSGTDSNTTGMEPCRCMRPWT
jgi:Homeodomain-like domain